jgi:hypothetical protein
VIIVIVIDVRMVVPVPVLVTVRRGRRGHGRMLVHAAPSRTRRSFQTEHNPPRNLEPWPSPHPPPNGAGKPGVPAERANQAYSGIGMIMRAALSTVWRGTEPTWSIG